MTEEMGGVAVLLTGLLLWLWQEAFFHQRRLVQFTLRVHVNGTRGKSSVTRLIAAGLEAGGRKVVAKTSGTEAKVIWPGGREEKLPRRGPANIKEVIGVVKAGAAKGGDTLVVECMAIRPELQWFMEHRLLRSHIGVITNVRADHEDVMGKGRTGVAAALGATIPDQGILVTTEGSLDLLTGAGAERESVMEAVSEKDVSPEERQAFSYEVVEENVALALKVCELAGVDRRTALMGMAKARPDLGNLTVSQRSFGKKNLRLINALAANDPESTLWLWQRYVPADEGVDRVLINCRQDRKMRTAQLCAAMAKVHDGGFLLAGDWRFARRQLLAAGVAEDRIEVLADGDGRTSWESYLDRWGKAELWVFAVGNVQGMDVLMGGDEV